MNLYTEAKCFSICIQFPRLVYSIAASSLLLQDVKFISNFDLLEGKKHNYILELSLQKLRNALLNNLTVLWVHLMDIVQHGS